jgi:hypothetical protein
VTVILRNRVLHQYTVAEKELHVPVPNPDRPALMDVVLAYEAKDAVGDIRADEVRTFQVGPLRFQPAAENIFVIGDTMHVVAQAFGAKPGHKVDFELRSGAEAVRSISSPVLPNGMVADQIRLDDLVGGNYELYGRLVSPAGEVLSEKTVPLTLSPRSIATRPGFIYRRGFNTQVPGLIPFVRGEQLWNVGRFEEAKVELERAVAASPQLAPAKWKLANAYLREQKPDEALSLLRPLESSFQSQYEVVAGLGFALYLKGDCAAAVPYLESARKLRPPDTLLLNSAGDCHRLLGNAAAAREAFQRSLELDPNQPEIKGRLEELPAAERGKS